MNNTFSLSKIVFPVFIYMLTLVLSTCTQAQNAKLTLKSPLGEEFWQVGKSPFIQWEASGIDQVQIEYSINNGTTWAYIATVNAALNQYAWTVPATPSKYCLVRLTSGNLVIKSSQPFEITADAASCPIVILGSSTSAGRGATTLG